MYLLRATYRYNFKCYCLKSIKCHFSLLKKIFLLSACCLPQSSEHFTCIIVISPENHSGGGYHQHPFYRWGHWVHSKFLSSQTLHSEVTHNSQAESNYRAHTPSPTMSRGSAHLRLMYVHQGTRRGWGKNAALISASPHRRPRPSDLPIPLHGI